MKIILLRHGETDWNFQQKYQGHRDIPLNARGREQAQKVARTIIDENIEAVYSSDLSRARETAEIIAGYFELPVIIDPRLREFSFGEWEGKTFNEVYHEYPVEYHDWYENTMDFKVPGGESMRQLLERVWLALRDISRRHSGTVLVVAHGGVLRAVLYKVGGENREDLWGELLQPGSILELVIQNGAVELGRIDGRKNAC